MTAPALHHTASPRPPSTRRLRFVVRILLIALGSLLGTALGWAASNSLCGAVPPPPPASPAACPIGGSQAAAQMRVACATSPPAGAPTGCHTQRSAKNRVDYGFLSERESPGGRPVTTGYIPTNKKTNTVIGQSGVTIGVGVDLGQQTAAALQAEGVSGSLITILTPYLGLQGQTAATYLNQHPLTITTAQAQALTQAVQTHLINTIAGFYTAAAVPPSPFFQLPAGAQTAIADLAYQYGPYLSRRTPIYWSQVTRGEWGAAVQNLNHFGDAYPTRRQAEGRLIQGDITGGQLPLTEASCT